MKTRPWTGSQGGRRQKPSPNRIQMDVVNQVSPGLSRLHKQGLEAALEQVTVLLAVAIEAHRESRLQPAHSGRQIAPRRPKAKVEMVRHQAIRRQFPPELPASLEQSLLERRLRSAASKIQAR